ncbi:MAG: TonB-dependent receptor [Steroidobacteraceae bacterium]
MKLCDRNSTGAKAGLTGLLMLSSTLCLAQAQAQSQAQAQDDASVKTMSKLVAQDEQEVSEFLTGGDVDVVTREEIDEKHYTTIEEAVKRIPGVQVSTPGYKASEYGTTFGGEISINGDSGVIIMVDGRRLDNDASSYGGARSKSRVPLDMITNIGNVERIEVVKGAGAAVFGAEATGGVINIITRSGGERHATSLDAAAGSWGKQNYALTQSGPLFTDSLRYFASLSYASRDDSKYHDAYTDKTQTYDNTGYREKAASLRLDQSFSDTQSLGLYYSGTTNKSQYPITAPDYATLYLLYGNALPTGTGASTRPGYRNWFLYDAWLGSYTAETSNDVDLKYTFAVKDGYDSHVRAYKNYRRYSTRDFAGLFGTQFGNITPALIATALTAAGTQRREEVTGVELQLARKLGLHGLTSGWDVRNSELNTLNVRTGTRTLVKRKGIEAYVQDKMEITDRYTFTPGVRYSNFSKIKRTSATDVVTEKSSSVDTAFSLFTNYRFDSIGNVYASWAQIFRPLSNYDYDSETTEKLLDEEGNNWTLGIQKTFVSQTSVELNYSLLDMDNATARYSVWDPTAVNAASPTGFGANVTRSVNATQKKKAYNATVQQLLGEHWTLKASYAYVDEKFEARNFAINTADTTNINALINRFRTPRTYQAEAQFTQGKWSANANVQYLTGNDTTYFTARHFTVLGGGVNYQLFSNTRVYATIDNLTDEAYETRASTSYGPGAFPQPGRNWTIGVQQKL